MTTLNTMTKDDINCGVLETRLQPTSRVDEKVSVTKLTLNRWDKTLMIMILQSYSPSIIW